MTSNKKRFLLAAAVTLLIGCTSPEEQVANYIASGDTLLNNGQLAKAGLQYKNALKIKDDVAAAWWGLATIAQQQGNPKEAYQYARRVLEIEPKNVPALILVTRNEVQQKPLADAEKRVAELQQFAPDNAATIAAQAFLALRKEDQNAAVEYAQQALRVDAGNEAAGLLLVGMHYRAGAHAQALQQIDNLLAHTDANSAILSAKIRVLGALKDAVELEKTLQQAIALDQDNTGLRLMLVQLYINQMQPDAAEDEMRVLVANRPDDLNMLRKLLNLIRVTRGEAAVEDELKARIADEPQKAELQFLMVGLRLEQDNPDEAMAILRSVASDNDIPDTDRHTAQARMASMMMSDGNVTDAMALLNEVLAADPSHEQAVLLRSSVRIDNRELTDAIADLRTVLQDNPKSVPALMMLARAYQADGAIALASETYGKAWEASDLEPGVALPYAQFLQQQGQADRAQEVIESSVQRNGDNEPLLQALAQRYLQIGDVERADAVVKRIEAIAEDSDGARRLRASLLLLQQDYDESIAAFQDNVSSSDDTGAALSALIGAYLRADKEAEARAYLEQVLQDDPNHREAARLQAQLLVRAGEFDAAEAAFEGLIARAPEMTSTYFDYARYALMRGDETRAFAIMEQGLDKNPNSFSLGVRYTSMLEAKGDSSAAVPYYEHLLELRPNADLIANNLASALADRTGDTASQKRAVELATRFRESKVPEFRDTLGWAYYRVGRMDNALRFIQSAADERPNRAIIQYHLGRVLTDMGRKEDAKEALTAANEANPSDAEAQLIKAALMSLSASL